MSAALCHRETAAAQQCEIKQIKERIKKKVRREKERKGPIKNGPAEREEQI